MTLTKAKISELLAEIDQQIFDQYIKIEEGVRFNNVRMVVDGDYTLGLLREEKARLQTAFCRLNKAPNIFRRFFSSFVLWEFP